MIWLSCSRWLWVICPPDGHRPGQGDLVLLAAGHLYLAVGPQSGRLLRNICLTGLGYDFLFHPLSLLLQLRVRPGDEGHPVPVPVEVRCQPPPGQRGQHRRRHHQARHDASRPAHAPLGHDAVCQGAQNGRRRHAEHPAAQCIHHVATTAVTAETRLIIRMRAQLPVMPSISPKAPPTLSMSPLRAGGATVAVRAAAPL